MANYTHCDCCGNELFGDEPVYEFDSQEVCEECFIDLVKKLHPNEVEEADICTAQEFAEYFDVYCTTAEDSAQNVEDLAMEANYEDR